MSFVTNLWLVNTNEENLHRTPILWLTTSFTCLFTYLNGWLRQSFQQSVYEKKFKYFAGMNCAFCGHWYRRNCHWHFMRWWMFSGRTYEDLADTSKHVQAIYKTWCCPVVSICLRIQTITFEIGQKWPKPDKRVWRRIRRLHLTWAITSEKWKIASEFWR